MPRISTATVTETEMDLFQSLDADPRENRDRNLRVLRRRCDAASMGAIALEESVSPSVVAQIIGAYKRRLAKAWLRGELRRGRTERRAA